MSSRRIACLIRGVPATDATIETSDIALMSDDLLKVSWLIRHSRRTLRNIKTNITFALGLKFLFIVLAIVGLASLWMAIAADTGATLLVVFNGLVHGSLSLLVGQGRLHAHLGQHGLCGGWRWYGGERRARCREVEGGRWWLWCGVRRGSRARG